MVADDPAATRVAAAVLIVLAAACLLRGLPWPHTDDVAFAGAGIELARTGQLTNSYIAGFLRELGTDKFYLQPPLQTYTLAGWLHLFGVGTASLRVFQWLWYLAGGVGIVRLGWRFGLPTAAGLLLAGVNFLGLVGTGFRPEAEAFALLFLGLSLVDSTAGFAQKLGALVLLGFAPLAYPLTLGIAVPFAGLLIALTQPVKILPTRQRFVVAVRAWGPALAVAVAVVAVVFLWMIRFDVTGFLAGYGAHMKYRAGYVEKIGGKLHYFLGTLFQGIEAVLTLPLVLALAVAAGWVAWRRGRFPTATRGLVLACLTAAVCCEFLYVVLAVQWVVWLAFCALTALACAQTTRTRRRAGLAVVAALGLAHHFFPLLDLCLRRFPEPSAFEAARKAAGGSSKDLMVDSSTMRYVFDYRPPRTTRVDSLSTARRADGDPCLWVITLAHSQHQCGPAHAHAGTDAAHHPGAPRFQFPAALPGPAVGASLNHQRWMALSERHWFPLRRRRLEQKAAAPQM